MQGDARIRPRSGSGGFWKTRRRPFGLPGFAVAVLAAGSAATEAGAQTAAHVAAVKTAQTLAYAISDATNGCPLVGADMFGWPGPLVRKCIYAEGPNNKRLPGLVYLLDVKPGTIAQWIETACAKQLPNVPACFATVLKCGRSNSGMMFAVSGNVLENMNPTTWKNYFFRNGMTVSMTGQPNGTANAISLERQEELAQAPDSSIQTIPSGLTRYWRTLPKQFAARFPDAGAPVAVNTPALRQKWLDLARAEFLAALTSPTNRLLEAWVAAHPVKLSAGKCPADTDP